MLELTRRTLITGIGATLCAGAVPTFVPSLIGGGFIANSRIVTITNRSAYNIFLSHKGSMASSFNYVIPKHEKISVVAADLGHKDFQVYIAEGLLKV